MNRLIFTGWTPGTLWKSVPMYELHQGGRFTCHLTVDESADGTHTCVNYAFTHGPFGTVHLPRLYVSNDGGRRRAIVRALLSVKGMAV